MTNFDFSQYISPLSWRYGSAKMKHIFSEEHKYRLWRSVWVALARAEYKAGLVSKKEFNDLLKHQHEIDIPRTLQIEEVTHHDLVAGIKQFAEVASIGGGKIHLGATSMDITDNADAVRIFEALEILETKLKGILTQFAQKIEEYADLPCMGYTHLQPAEPTTVGYRLASYAQDLLTDLAYVQFVKKTFAGKGMKGAVGTRASYQAILCGTKITPEQLDRMVAKELGIPVATITTQVYPRKFDYLVLSLLAGISSTFAKFAGDVRLLQSPAIGEWSEPFGKTQVGSSAMPFKKNPINSEKICSLARFVASLPGVALENATLSYLERTLDDSANKRIIISEGFIAVDEIVLTAEKLLNGLVIDTERILYNLNQYGPFAATEVILVELVKKQANRQEMHELLRTISLAAWEDIKKGKVNPMQARITNNPTILRYITTDQIAKSFDMSHHIGDAPKRAKELVKKIREGVKK